MSDLVKFMENKLGGKIEMSEAEMFDFLNFYEIYHYDGESIKSEIQESEPIKEYLFDFIDIKGLAEYLNYSVVSNDCFIDNNSLNDFLVNFEVEYNRSISNVIRLWNHVSNEN